MSGAWERLRAARLRADVAEASLKDREDRIVFLDRTIAELHVNLDAANVACDAALADHRRLTSLLNTPEMRNFFEGVRVEAAHQLERWGPEHDREKDAGDWALLFNHLLGKQARAAWDGNRPKLLHHLVTTAAVCFHYHRCIMANELNEPNDRT